MENIILRLTEVVTHCCDVKTFRFELEKEVVFKPGQYLVLTLLVGGKDVSKAFSISSSPTEKGFMQFTKKISDSDFSKELLKLVVGQKYRLRMPLGKFTFEGEFPKVAFLSGGIGITPIRSIFKYATDKKLSSDLMLLYSSRTPQYLIFRNDFVQMERENRNIKVIYTLTDCEEKQEGCLAGRIDDEFIKRHVPDYNDRIFFICGPPGMVGAMKSMLIEKLLLPPQKIVIEDFVGY